MVSPPTGTVLLPGDHLNFSFSPSSPPLAPSHLAYGVQPPFPIFDPSGNTTTSTVSPALFSPHSAASTASISQSIAHSLGPPRAESPMDEDEGAAASPTKRAADEDELRRGPPTSDTPGGDCKSLCLRHQRMANGGTNLMLQKSIETLSPHDQAAVNTVWSLFSSSPSRRRLLILQGLLTIACPSQLSFLQDALTLEMRLDPVELLPREIGLKVFGYLDAISLGRAAQVSKTWKSMADDDLLWRTMCEQHIERKCEKCGWGLPLLGERRRRARGAINALPGKAAEKAGSQHDARRTATPDIFTPPQHPIHAAAPPLDLSTIIATELSSSQPNSPATATSSQFQAMAVDSTDNHRTKRARTNSPAPSRSTSPHPMSPRPSSRASIASAASAAAVVPTTRPWKLVYCERLAIERNWRRGTCVATVLSGHTDSITCLQVAEDLPHPSFPVLMTGSWDRSVRIWNLETGKEVGVLRGHTRGVRALQFDALKLVTGSMDSTLKIWNWRTGECMRTLRGHRDAVICLTYDKQLLISGSGDSTIRVWDFGTGEVQTLRGHTEWVNSVALWDSNAECGTGGPKDVDAGDLGAPTTNPEAAKASSKGKFLFSASDDTTIRVWDLYTRQCVRVLSGHVAQVQSLKVTTSDEILAAFPPSALHPTTSSSTSRGPLAITPAAANANGRSTTTTSDDDSVDAQNRSQVVDGNAYEGFFDQPSTSSTSCATTSLSAATTSASASTAPAANSSMWTTAARVTPPDATGLADLDSAGDKKPWVVSASLDNTIKVWDVEGGACQRTMFGHIEGVWDVDVDKLRIVSASHDRTLKIWDRDTGKCLHTLVGHTGAVSFTLAVRFPLVLGADPPPSFLLPR
ncbi:quinon protein alcohol dehydrogenase-like superfamily [Leucosporidium creatinivorum]|uniref:Quinon protein alcohol dehydrogenase-like superfamily n=1 Tax=Leucosporidium creatinivorum TaxID=106004 RepID=A0A1Y2DMJ7_9BASI|nr:quinon protein alcohol dehydrogenase-like superfamily [Leucosporidium creatinivorum]